MYDIYFKGIKAWDLGAAVATRPSIPPPKQRGEFVEIAGRDGSLLVTDGTYENIEIEIEMNIVRRPEWLGNSYRAIKSWLQGSGELVLGDDPDVFYRVKIASVTEMERRTKFGADLEATFICDPFTYIKAGKNEYEKEDVLLNPYYEARPKYIIRGEGICTLTVNENEMTANVGQDMIIDTDLMMTYRENGTLQNTEVTGDYEKLVLKSGHNEIEITEGFDLKVVPNWRSL